MADAVPSSALGTISGNSLLFWVNGDSERSLCPAHGIIFPELEFRDGPFRKTSVDRQEEVPDERKYFDFILSDHLQFVRQDSFADIFPEFTQEFRCRVRVAIVDEKEFLSQQKRLELPRRIFRPVLPPLLRKAAQRAKQ